MVKEDTDGWHVVDYLGEQVRAFYPTDKGPQDIDRSVRVAYKFIGTQLDLWRKEKNTELTSRYARLRHYFRSNAHLWPESITDSE
jgi:hypothetical protein